MFDVTGLQCIVNLSSKSITFSNLENKAHNRTIPAGSAGVIANAWIPWVDNGDQFKGHHMVLQSDGRIISVWQSGHTIRYSNDDKWSADARTIPGESAVNQSVAWVLDGSGNLTQTHWV